MDSTSHTTWQITPQLQLQLLLQLQPQLHEDKCVQSNLQANIINSGWTNLNDKDIKHQQGTTNTMLSQMT